MLVLVSWLFWPSASQQTPNGSNGTGYPQDVPYVPYSTVPSTGSGGTDQPNVRSVAVTARDGQMYEVRDFLNNGETVKDAVNPGYFILAGDAGYCLANGQCIKGAPSDEFFISYNQRQVFFNISLIKEPLAQSRKNAEAFLMDRLGLNQTQMCTLDYYVTVSSSVNPVYAGKNLGWSFCPGAVQL